MFSVTQMVDRVTQPAGGYLPVKSMHVQTFDDGRKIDTSSPRYSALSVIQGISVDYLTRFMSGCPLEEVFAVSLMGADRVDELDKAEILLKQIRGLDDASVIAACKLASYDVAYRRDTDHYSHNPGLIPDDSIISNIRIMVQRGQAFLHRHAPLIRSGITFEGGYTNLVSSGDGDYLTKDGLWDFKVSLRKPGSAETLQILMYYILGMRSVHPEFGHIRTIGLFNPLRNQSYEIDLSEIPDDVFRAVSHDVLGLRVPDDPKRWRETDGEDEDVLDRYIRGLGLAEYDTAFDPGKYEDGIYDISIDDYWTYYRKTVDRAGFRPKFPRTVGIKFLKHAGFMMFVSVSPRGYTSVLQGGCRRNLDKPLSYYYSRLPEYANSVLRLFSRYWDAVSEVSDFVKRFSGGTGGRVHGCIVDIDFFNHIYVNPFDGTVTPYYAGSMAVKQTYRNVASLLSEQIPHLLPAFRTEQSLNPTALVLADEITPRQAVALTGQEITDHSDIVYDTEMYNISNRLKVLQMIRDYHLVAVWYESMLPKTSALPDMDDAGAGENDLQADQRVEADFANLISVDRDERCLTQREKRTLRWRTKCRMTQEDLFALIRKMLRDEEKSLSMYDRMRFSYTWTTKTGYQYVTVECRAADVLLFYRQLLKPERINRNKTILKLEIREVIQNPPAALSVDFEGAGPNPLKVKGEYVFKSGTLEPVER